MFVWSSSASPVSDVFGGNEFGAHDQNQKEVKLNVSPGKGLFFLFPNFNFFFLPLHS
jgi:auxin efflux carrier family